MATLPGAGDETTSRRHLLLFSLLALAHLLPIWLFRYVPTQDGPAHLGNAVILRDYGTPGTRHHEFFALAYEPFPNWTSHLLLAVLSRAVQPLFAEKLLVSAYVLAFAFACRYFLASWPGTAVLLAPLCLLFVYNRCFFMGFYNYCLSVPLLFLILGLCMRMGDRPSPWSLIALAGLFLAAYFTHLMGYVQAALGAVALSLFLPGNRWRRLLGVGAALLPAAALVANYLASSGFSLRADSVRAERSWFGEGLLELAHHTFNPYQAWSLSIGWCWLLTYAALATAGLVSWFRHDVVAMETLRTWWAALLLGMAMTLVYLLAPDTFGRHGGYLKARLALVLPLMWLAILRLGPEPWLRCPALLAIYALVIAQLVCTCSHFAAANRSLDRYTAGLGHVTGKRVVYVMQSKHQEPYEVSYLLHASHYYCLERGATNLDNYEAGGHYFPVRFRNGVTRGRGDGNDFAAYARRDDVDMILAWAFPRPGPAPEGFGEIHRAGSLAIYRRVLR